MRIPDVAGSDLSVLTGFAEASRRTNGNARLAVVSDTLCRKSGELLVIVKWAEALDDS